MRGRAALLLMAASGFAGLGYQIVWTQQSALWLGHEAAAVLAVVTAFFGGLAAGAVGLSERIERSARPARWYAACEAIVALWGMVLLVAMAPASAWLLHITGPQPDPLRQWAVAFAGTFVLLLPATAAMGATLPAMERLTTRMRDGERSIALLYAANTAGAVAGVLAAALWLVPALGLARTSAVCIGLNLACAAASLLLFGQATAATRMAPSAASARRHGVLPLAATGLLGIAYEVLVVHTLSQVTENTVYTYALLLAVYLTGTALGAAAYQRWLSSGGDGERLRNRLLCAMAAACLAGTASLLAIAPVKDWALAHLGKGMGAALVAEALVALVAFGPPTLLMGALFSHLSAAAGSSGATFGRALGINTLGAAAAPVLFGVLLLPAFGPKGALLVVGAGYLALLSRRAWPAGLALGGAAAALALWLPPLVFVDVPPGGRIVSHAEGVEAAVSVVEDAAGVARLRINNRQQEGSSATQFVDGRQALLPLFLHAGPKRALFLGLGTGVTASTAALDPGLAVDAVELLPEVIAASRHFAPDGAPPAQLHVIAADARRYVRASDARYDVIVSDNFHPARSGSGALYTVEHFEAVRARLAPGGLFCQWLPLHQLDLATLRSIVRSFISVYPDGRAMLASNSLQTPVLGLVATADGAPFDAAALHRRLAGAAPAQDPAAYGIDDEYALLGSFVAGPQALAAYAGDAVPNTDDRPIVAYQAPRITYVPDSSPDARLAALLGELSIRPDELVGARSDAGVAARLAAYWSARDRFIEIGRHVRPTRDAQAMLAQVRQPLLSVLRISPDFRPAYDPLVRMAASVAETDSGAARGLLTELANAQPARPEAAQLLAQLGGS
jgi:spermidine synthase